MSKKIKVKCPQCEKEFFYYESDFRPFCSERCKEVDLGHWLTESYQIPGKVVADERQMDEFEIDEDFFTNEDE